VDDEEPRRIAEAVRALALQHVVITSVNRDELSDGGAAVFAETIRLTREYNPGCTIEVLIPDFEGNAAALEVVCREQPDILNHNIETVPRLFPILRPQGKYQRSIDLLARANAHGRRTKSGIIVGMGETPDEICHVLRDLRTAGCDVVTIGQYLQPTKAHLPVVRFMILPNLLASKPRLWPWASCMWKQARSPAVPITPRSTPVIEPGSFLYILHPSARL